MSKLRSSRASAFAFYGWATLCARSLSPPPEVKMTNFKTRLYTPALITVVTVLAATGAGFRTS